MYFIEDEHFARQLQNELQAYENFRKEKEGKQKENLNPVDSKLEFMDPTPSIHDLFMKFNKKFFWNALGMVEVVWSSRMTKCAGLCSFEGGRGLCKVALSAPLLSLRPRKDLVETLLHEMIHAYLFVTHNYKDRDDHGPEFHKHMIRINKEAGTNITVYHTFYDEVEYYQRHIWRCNGPCQKNKPYFGFVRRAINRAPGPNDPWWKEHKINCGGTFIKISEPEKKPRRSKKIIVVKPREKHKDIRDYFSEKGNSQRSNKSEQESNIKTLADLKERSGTGAKMNAGTGTIVITNTNKENLKSIKQTKGSTKTNSTGTSEKIKISGANLPEYNQSKAAAEKTKKDSNSEDIRETVRNKWANKYTNSKPPDSPSAKKIKLQTPVRGEGSSKKEMQTHVDELSKNVSSNEESNNSSEAETFRLEEIDKYKRCPVCNGKILQSEMDDHLETCLNCSFVNEGDNELDNEIMCESVPCPCCYKWFQESEMNDHIDECLTLNTLKEEILTL